MLTVESSQPFELQRVISNQRAKLNHTQKPGCSQETSNLVRSGWTVREECSSVGPSDVGKGQEQESEAGRNHQRRLLEGHSQEIQQLGRAHGTTSQIWQTSQAHWPVLTFSPPWPCLPNPCCPKRLAANKLECKYSEGANTHHVAPYSVQSRDESKLQMNSSYVAFQIPWISWGSSPGNQSAP